MEIVNGKWVDSDGSSVTAFNFSKLKAISKKVKAVYGKNITYERIKIISMLNVVSREKESHLQLIVEHTLKKLI